MSSKIYHKLVAASKKCESYSFMLCNHTLKNSELEKNNDWKDDCKFLWKDVTCEKCLSMRYLKYLRKRYHSDFRDFYLTRQQKRDEEFFYEQ